MASVLRADNISKSFGPIEVLRDISLDLQPGEIHAVIGENGAGKSTLMRILSGHLSPTDGTIHLEGRPISFSSPVEAEQRGVVLVHQEILLADDLTVAQNVYLGREVNRYGFVDDKAMRDNTRVLLTDLGTLIDPDAYVRDLSIADRQLVQIARALLVPHRVVAFDEPTAVLTPVEAERLFAIIRRLKAQGAAVLYISHRLNEVKAMADRVTILRDGRLVTSRANEALEPLEMARLMVGRDMSRLYPNKPPVAGDAIVLAARDFSVPGYVSDASFELQRGEILGFGGLIGAGRTELFEGIIGLRPAHGLASVHGAPVRFRDSRGAMAAGVVYLSEDRKGKGLLLQQNLCMNLTLAALKQFSHASIINRRAEEDALDEAIRDFDIRARSRGMLAGQLSGGNQQKLLLAKMMLADPQIVIIDEPTRGVDIGTKQQIYRFIASLAEQGRSVIVISSEMQELIGLCHRVLVMRNGKIAGEVSGRDLSEDSIVFLATGVHEERAAEIAAGNA